MLITLFKTLLIFARTFFYLLLSYRKGADVTELKRQWAFSILKDFHIHLREINKPAERRNLILLGNHIGFLDIIVLIAAEPRIVFLSKAEVASWPIIGAGAKRIGTLFVKRDSAQSRAQSKQDIYSRLKENTNSQIYIGGFPSGTTALNENKPWRKGLFEIAQDTKTDVQCFRFKYTPLRACAYIDQDNLLLSMMRLFKTPHKSVTLHWGPCGPITDLTWQMEAMQKWTQMQPASALDYKDEKAFTRPAHSLEVLSAESKGTRYL